MHVYKYIITSVDSIASLNVTFFITQHKTITWNSPAAWEGRSIHWSATVSLADHRIISQKVVLKSLLNNPSSLYLPFNRPVYLHHFSSHQYAACCNKISRIKTSTSLFHRQNAKAGAQSGTVPRVTTAEGTPALSRVNIGLYLVFWGVFDTQEMFFTCCTESFTCYTWRC